MRFIPSLHRRWLDAEHARIARWFGASEIGPVYFDPGARALPLSVDERELWLAHAGRLVERHAVQQRWVGFETIAIVSVLMSAMTVAVAMLGDMVPALRTIPAPLVAGGGLGWPLLHDRIYRRKLRALRHEIAARLSVRSPLPPKPALRGKRSDLFAGAALATVFAAIGWAVLAAIHGGRSANPLPSLALLPVACLLHYAARAGRRSAAPSRLSDL